MARPSDDVPSLFDTPDMADISDSADEIRTSHRSHSCVDAPNGKVVWLVPLLPRGKVLACQRACARKHPIAYTQQLQCAWDEQEKQSITLHGL